MSELILTSDIPNNLPNGSDLNLGIEIKRSLQRDLKECRWSREEVAARLSIVMARPITLAQINAYTADTKPHRFPLELLAAWVVITGSRRLLDVVVPAAGDYVVADSHDQKLAAYARTLLEREAVTAREAKQRAELLALRKETR